MCTEDCGRLQPPDEHALISAFEIAMQDAFAFLAPDFALEPAPLRVFAATDTGPVAIAPAEAEYPFLAVQEFTGANPPVRISYGDRSYRLRLEVGANGSGYHALNDWKAALSVDLDDRDDSGVATPTSLARHARRLAHSLRPHFEAICRAGPDVMSRLGNNGNGTPLTDSREAANAAFAAGDYAAYVRLLEPHRESLTTTELRKLSFATDKIA